MLPDDQRPACLPPTPKQARGLHPDAAVQTTALDAAQGCLDAMATFSWRWGSMKSGKSSAQGFLPTTGTMTVFHTGVPINL